MVVCSCINTCAKIVLHLGFQRIQYSAKTRCCPSLIVRRSVSPNGSQEASINFSCGYLSASLDFVVPKRVPVSDGKCNFQSFSWPKGSITAGLISGLLVCCTASDSVHAEAPEEKGDKEEYDNLSSVQFSHGKRVYTDYSVIGAPIVVGTIAMALIQLLPIFLGVFLMDNFGR